MWSGSISFGLVNIPVKLYTAVSRKSVRFNQIDATTAPASGTRRCRPNRATRSPTTTSSRATSCRRATTSSSPTTSWRQLDPKASRTIDIEEFVDLADIDPIFYDAAYYLAPDKATAKPYALLCRGHGGVGQGRHRPRS